MKVVIIGACGHINYALNSIKINKDLHLCGVAGADPSDSQETLSSISKEYSCRFYDSYAYMLEDVTPDVAVIATRYDLNGKISLQCLQRHINCFTEKAVAHDLRILEALKNAAYENKTKIIGMHGMRYTPAIYAVWQELKKGSIGTPMLITGQKSYKFGEHRPEFYKHREYYGGTILWVATHAIDWTYWLMGRFESVYAIHSNKYNFNYGDCETSAVISFKLASGAMGTITADFYQPMMSKSHGDDRLRIVGDKGVMRVEYGKAYICTHDNEEKELPLLPEGDFFGDFCREIRGEGKCRLSMEDTFEVTKTALLAREAADMEKVRLI